MSNSRRRFLQLAAGGLTASLPRSVHMQSHAESSGPFQEFEQPRDGDEAVLACAGDWFLTRRLSGETSVQTNAVFDVFRRAHAGFVNLENGLSTIGSGELGGFRQGAALRGDPSLVSELAWGGVGTVSLANNHTGNYGREALLQTIATLDQARVAHAGAGATLERALSPAIVKAGNLTIAFFSAYTLYHQFGAADQAGPDVPGVAVCRAYDVVVAPQTAFDVRGFDAAPFLLDLETPRYDTILAASRADLDRLKNAVRAASTKADFTLLSVHVHWGRHTRHDLPPNLRAFAHEMIDAGVDLFVGHGPHAIRGVELYRGKPIVHSMGNFVLMPSSSRPSASAVANAGHEGLIVRAIVGRRTVRSLELLPVSIDEHGDPGFPSHPQAARTVGKLTGLSAAFGLDVASKGWFAVVPMG